MVPYVTLRLRLFPHLRWGFANYSIKAVNSIIILERNTLFFNDMVFPLFLFSDLNHNADVCFFQMSLQASSVWFSFLKRTTDG